jgi:prepilin-type N-terminal cleavage/methylation domain-containing protein
MRQRAFTLAELVVVMAIMTILTGLTVPAVRGLTSSSALDTGAREFADLLHLARSEAISQHTIVRFALVTQWTGQDDAPLRKASLWSWDSESQQYFQTTNWETLPTGIIMETSIPTYVQHASYATNDASSIRGDCVLDQTFAQQNGFTSNDTGATVTMQFVQFLPTGGAQIPGGSSRNVIFVMTPGYQNTDGSVAHTTQYSGQAANWAQLNVDTLTGRVRVYQP